jgi:hypothetical protein
MLMAIDRTRPLGAFVPSARSTTVAPRLHRRAIAAHRLEMETIYRVEWFTMQQLTRAGLAKDALRSGDDVVITGSQNRNPELNVMTLLTAIGRPSDGWSWSRPRADVCSAAK